jgi:hypothetical protein
MELPDVSSETNCFKVILTLYQSDLPPLYLPRNNPQEETPLLLINNLRQSFTFTPPQK